MDFKNLVIGSWQNTINFIGPVLLITLAHVVIMFISLGILAPVTSAGYVDSLMRAARDGRKPQVGDLFSQMRLFLPLLGFAVVAVVVILVAFTLLVVPGIAVAVLIYFGAFYLLPLMTDRGLGLIDGLKTSWRMATQQPITDHVIVIIIHIAITSLSSSLPFAFLITNPIATFILIGAYRQRLSEAAIESSPADAASSGPAAAERQETPPETPPPADSAAAAEPPADEPVEPPEPAAAPAKEADPETPPEEPAERSGGSTGGPADLTEDEPAEKKGGSDEK